jgi:hypothetical protein
VTAQTARPRLIALDTAIPTRDAPVGEALDRLYCIAPDIRGPSITTITTTTTADAGIGTHPVLTFGYRTRVGSRRLLSGSVISIHSLTLSRIWSPTALPPHSSKGSGSGSAIQQDEDLPELR